MDGSGVEFTNRLGEAIAPFLLWLRDLSFFEWYVYVPIMTVTSAGIFWRLTKKLDSNGTFSRHSARRRLVWLAAYYGLCFLVTNALAVAFKTLIVEELDYPTRVWFEAYVGPLHFYIVSVVIAYLALIVRNTSEALDRLLGVFVQIGLIAGYVVGLFRIFNEGVSLLEPTSGFGGFVLCAYFALYNYDLYQRFIGGRAIQT